MSQGTAWAPRGVAILRVALVPIILAIESTIAFPRRGPDPGFRAVLVVAFVYAVVTVVLTLRSPQRPPGGWRPYTLIDAGLLGLLTWRSGGATSEIRTVLAAMPFGAALIGRPRATLDTVVLVLCVYLAAAVSRDVPSTGYLGGESLLFLWRGALALLLSQAVTSAREVHERRDAERQQLLARIDSAAEHARQELAYELHDEVLQDLYTARMKLGASNEAAATTAKRAVDHAVSRLRAIVLDLRPADIARVGAAQGLREVASQLARSHPPIDIDVAFDPDAASPHDELLLTIGRELLTNAVKHSAATHVALTVSREGGDVVLEVDDDGHGMAPGRRRQAADEGHIGLLACQERVATAGGALRIRSADRGTTVTARIPVVG